MNDYVTAMLIQLEGKLEAIEDEIEGWMADVEEAKRQRELLIAATKALKGEKK